MAITNKKTLEKMKKKNPKSIRVGDDGKVTNAGKKSSKKSGSIFESPRSKAIRLSTAAGKANRAASDTMKAAEKKYAKESMFKKSADARDKAKTTPGKARSFKDAFDSATKEGKSRFMLGGKSYLTTKGKREKRFDPTKTKAAEPKKGIVGKLNEKIRSFRKKTTGFSTQAEYESAADKRRIQKRITKMKERKNQGKNYSAKNLAELEAKLKDM